MAAAKVRTEAEGTLAPRRGGWAWAKLPQSPGPKGIWQKGGTQKSQGLSNAPWGLALGLPPHSYLPSGLRAGTGTGGPFPNKFEEPFQPQQAASKKQRGLCAGRAPEQRRPGRGAPGERLLQGLGRPVSPLERRNDAAWGRTCAWLSTVTQGSRGEEGKRLRSSRGPSVRGSSGKG